MYIFEKFPLSPHEKQEILHLCQRLLTTAESDSVAATETLAALCVLARRPLPLPVPLSTSDTWHLKRIAWNYATSPQILLTETLGLARRAQVLRDSSSSQRA